MTENTNAPLIEATVISAIKRIQNDPERSMRNIVDLALMFCNGKFQQRFLESAQIMLENENSSYYRIIPDLLTHTDMKRVTTFGINLGYNSCTYGARTIRKIKAEQGYNIPWCISLNISPKGYELHKEDYFSLIEQGKSLGIYTWFINPCGDYTSVHELSQHFSDCSFVIMCHPQDITTALLSKFDEIYNVLFSVFFEDATEHACTLLRQEKFLYSICYLYNEKDTSYISSQDIFYDIGSLNSPFTLLYAEADCPVETQLKIYEIILELRTNQTLPTIPFDVIHDLLFIDEIISESAVYLTVDTQGMCKSNLISEGNKTISIFEQSLEDLLKLLTSNA